METWNDEYRMGEPAAVYQVAEVKERVNPETPLLEKGDEIIDMGADFDFDGFQVVRREFFAHLAEPAVTFNNCRFYVNSACLNKFPDTNFVQVLVNRNTKIMALRPCAENARDSFAWCSISKGKRKPKQTTCKLFFAKIVSLMEWNPDYRYKLLGRLIHANGQYMIAFDLNATETYQRTFQEGSKPKTSRTPVFPAGWQDQFGLPYSTFDEAVVIAPQERDEETHSRSKTAERIAKDNHISKGTVEKYAIYARAMDALAEKDAEIVPRILSGQYKIAHKNVVELSKLSPPEIKKVERRIKKMQQPFIQYNQSRNAISEVSEGVRGTVAVTSIKDMPAFDPDADINGLALTIPSWSSSIDRVLKQTDLSIISSHAREGLVRQLLSLTDHVSDLLGAIKED